MSERDRIMVRWEETKFHGNKKKDARGAKNGQWISCCCSEGMGRRVSANYTSPLLTFMFVVLLEPRTKGPLLMLIVIEKGTTKPRPSMRGGSTHKHERLPHMNNVIYTHERFFAHKKDFPHTWKIFRANESFSAHKKNIRTHERFSAHKKHFRTHEKYFAHKKDFPHTWKIFRANESFSAHMKDFPHTWAHFTYRKSHVTTVAESRHLNFIWKNKSNCFLQMKIEMKMLFVLLYLLGCSNT